MDYFKEFHFIKQEIWKVATHLANSEEKPALFKLGELYELLRMHCIKLKKENEEKNEN